MYLQRRLSANPTRKNAATHLPIQPEQCRILRDRRKRRPRAPAKLVLEWVVRGFRCRQTTAERDERRRLLPFGLDLVEQAHGGAVVDAGVEPNLVEQEHACVLGALVEGAHGVRDVGGSDEVLLVRNASFGDDGMEGGGEEAA